MKASFRRLYPLIGCIAVVLVSCQKGTTDPSITLIEPNQGNENITEVTKPNPEEIVTVALVMKTLTNPFFVEMEKGARQAEDELGIRLLVKTASEETSIEQQIAIVNNLIEEEVSAIVIAPGDSVELVPVLKKAQDAGIVIINIDNRLDPQYAAEFNLVNVPFISVDNEQAAYLAAKTLSDQITAPTKVAILEGIRSAKNAESRKDGALRAFQENSNITDIVMKTANWKIDEAYQSTRVLLNEHPEIRAIFCANDMMALGVIQYLQEVGRTDVRVAGFDALAEALEAVKQGRLVATVDQQAAQQGYLGVTYAIQALRDQDLPEEMMVDVEVITVNHVSLGEN
jgi:ribose transport system substrate-binding protein